MHREGALFTTSTLHWLDIFDDPYRITPRASSARENRMRIEQCYRRSPRSWKPKTPDPASPRIRILMTMPG